MHKLCPRVATPDLGLYDSGEGGSSAQRQGPLELEAAFKGRALADIVLWLDALYKNLGPASVEGALSSNLCKIYNPS